MERERGGERAGGGFERGGGAVRRACGIRGDAVSISPRSHITVEETSCGSQLPCSEKDAASASHRDAALPAAPPPPPPRTGGRWKPAGAGWPLGSRNAAKRDPPGGPAAGAVPLAGPSRLLARARAGFVAAAAAAVFRQVQAAPAPSMAVAHRVEQRDALADCREARSGGRGTVFCARAGDESERKHLDLN